MPSLPFLCFPPLVARAAGACLFTDPSPTSAAVPYRGVARPASSESLSSSSRLVQLRVGHRNHSGTGSSHAPSGRPGTQSVPCHISAGRYRRPDSLSPALCLPCRHTRARARFGASTGSSESIRVLGPPRPAPAAAASGAGPLIGRFKRGFLAPFCHRTPSLLAVRCPPAHPWAFEPKGQRGAGACQRPASISRGGSAQSRWLAEPAGASRAVKSHQPSIPGAGPRAESRQPSPARQYPGPPARCWLMGRNL